MSYVSLLPFVVEAVVITVVTVSGCTGTGISVTKENREKCQERRRNTDKMCALSDVLKRRHLLVLEEVYYAGGRSC